MASYKEYLKKKDFINIPEQPKPSTPEQVTQTPKESIIPKPSQYKPQRYNNKTGKVEDVGVGINNSNVSRKEIMNQSKDFNTNMLQQQAEEQARLQAEQEQINLTKDALNVPEQTIDITQDTTQYPSYDPITKTWSDPTAANIIKNSQDQARMNKIPVLNVLNKITGALPNEVAGTNVGSIKKLILSAGKQNEEFRRYINDYSNLDNIDAIKQELIDANAEIESAKDLSMDFRYSSEAKLLYESALAKKRRAYNNYKLISKTSPEEFIKIKNDMSALETYFSSQKLNDDTEINENLYNARLKPMVR